MTTDSRGRSALTALAWTGLFLVVAPVALCSLAQVRVTVANRGAVTLEEVRVTISDVTDELGPLAPKEEKACWVRARGESGVTITYAAPAGYRVDTGSIGYLEPGYSGSMTFMLNERGVQDADWRVRMGF